MNSFEDIIQQKANNHEATVPADAWNNIERKRKKRRFGFFWLTLGILLAGLLVIGYYGNWKPGKEVVGKTDRINKVDEVNSTNNNHTKEPTKSDNKKALATNTAPKEKSTVTYEKIGNKNKANKIYISNRVEKSEKNPTTQRDEIKNSNRQSIAVINNKQKSGVLNTNHNAMVSTGKKDHANMNDLFAKREKISGKDKSKTHIKTVAGEITETTSADNKNKDSRDANTNPTTATVPLKKQANDEDRDLVNEKINEPAKISLPKKDTVIDSAQKKTAITFPNENKKEKTTTKKQSRRHAWFVDIAATPVLPIQEYNNAVTFNRTLFSNSIKSVFTGKLESTSIDPSVAFSASVRRSFSKRLYVGIGLQYLQLKEHISIAGTESNTKYNVVDSLVNAVSGPQLVSDTIETVTEGERKINATNSYSFLSIPIFLQYNFIQTRYWSIGGVAGVFVNIHGNYKNEINKNGLAALINTSQTIADKNTINLAFYGGLRIGRMVGKHTEFFALPSISTGLGRQDVKNSLLNKKIHRAGISVGLSFKIK